MAVSKVDAANQIENQLPQANIANNSPFRNIIINGDMNIAQRGTSFASASGYTLDRFTWTDSASSAFTISQDTDVPSSQGFSKSLKVACTTEDTSLGASDQIRIYQIIEAQNLQYLNYGTSSAKSLTASFWVKSNKTGTYCATLTQEDNSFAAYTTEYTINTADTWEKKTVTFDGDTSGVINNDNDGGLWLMFALGAGTSRHITAGSWSSSYGLSTSNQVNLADSDSNEFYITGVQLEAGTTASDFEFLPFDVNYSRCARYCWRPMYETSAAKYLHSQGGYKDANYIAFHVVPPVPMRAIPSVTEIGSVDVWYQNVTNTGFAWGFIMGIHSGAEWYVSGAKTGHGISDTNSIFSVIRADTNGWLQYNAEL